MKVFLLLAVVVIAVPAITAQTATTLSSQQIDALKKLKIAAEKQAAPYAARMAVTVKQIYDNMLAPQEDQRLRRKLARELHVETAKLLDLRGQSYRDALAILTLEQRQTLREALTKPDAPRDIGEAIAKTFGLSEK
jgi:hypothetical protein